MPSPLIEGHEGVKWELGFAFFRSWEMGFCAKNNFLGNGIRKNPPPPPPSWPSWFDQLKWLDQFCSEISAYWSNEMTWFSQCDIIRFDELKWLDFVSEWDISTFDQLKWLEFASEIPCYFSARMAFLLAYTYLMSFHWNRTYTEIFLKLCQLIFYIIRT